MTNENLKMSEPRKRRFNYGVGFGGGPKPPIYLEGMRVARELGRQLMSLSRTVWDIEMAIRNVRLAETGAEKAKAVSALEAILENIAAPSTEM